MSSYGIGNGGLPAGRISGMSDEKPEQAELALREFLRQRLENAASPRGVHLSREELSQWAASRDDTTAEDAMSLFERWEGTVWFGERVEGEHFSWNTAWITEVR
jgi:hypothetical protein